MKTGSILIYMFLQVAFCSAQEKILDQFKNMNMRSIGPATTSGRVTAIDVNPDKPNVIYAGTASGGVWKSESGGIYWTPIFDKQPVMGIGSVKIDPSNSDIIWVGTGEGNPRNSQTSGRGIFRSPDGGRTWKKMGLDDTRTIHRICIHPSNSEVVYAGAHGSAWGPTPDRGVYKTTDGGGNWEKILFVNDSVGCADLVMDPGNPDKLFAAMWQYQRQPWFFNSGGKGSGLHMTVDGGKTWKKLTDKEGLPEGILGRIGIAIAASNPKVIYALIEAKTTGLYKSTDGGYKWELVTTQVIDDRPFYYHELYVDPQNENHLIYLHSTVSESIDGGKSWTTLLPYYGVHPDHHAFWWSNKDSSYMIEGNDGGLNISRDGGMNWQFASNLPLGQFYHINYDMDIPYHVLGGMQDNGSWRGPGYVWHQGGITDADWLEVAFGDGFDVVPNPGDSRYNYAMSQGGYLVEMDLETGQERFVKPVHPENIKLRFNWNSGIAGDPFNNCGVYFGSQFLHYSNDCGTSWRVISPDLTTNDTTKQKSAQSGGLTIDATSAENFCTILAIAPSTLNQKIVWVGTDDGNVQLTTDGGNSWKNCSPAITGMPMGAWVPQIVPSTYSEGAAFVVVNDYRRNNWKPYLFYTSDYGKTWKNIVNESQVSGHCLSVVQDHVSPRLIFLGTENGLYVSFDEGSNWNQWKENYPSVATQDLKIHPRESDLIIGTFGRAAYVLDDISPLRIYSQQGKTLTDKKLAALPSTDGYQVNYLRPHGQRFPADSEFQGENKSGGAILRYYFKMDEPKKEEQKPAASAKNEKKEKTATTEQAATDDKSKKPEAKEEKPKDKKVTVMLFSMSGDTLRTLKSEPDTGVNVLSWGFDTKGVRGPSRRERKKDDDEPGGGYRVPPGAYKVVYKFNEFKDSTTVNVKADPRFPFDQASYDKGKILDARIRTYVVRADKSFEQLKSASKTIDLVKSSLVNVPDSVKKQVLSQADTLTKKINSLKDLFMFGEDVKGIRDGSDKLTNYLYNPFSYTDNGRMLQGKNAEDAVRISENEVEKVVQQVNTFFETDWKQWRTEVEKLDKPLFNEIEKL